ncbi:MAG: putative RNase H-like HicB family nuclease [Candidatus Omnitrophota bacterium]|jgi:predicted RNase H-like HicB family nuclease
MLKIGWYTLNMRKQPVKKTQIEAKIPVMYMKEGKVFVCYTPALNLASHGDTYEEARDNFNISLNLFIKEVTKMNTWDEVLSECGWTKEKNQFAPPVLIEDRLQSIKIPLAS